MKKLLALMLAAALALSLVACGGGGGTGDTNTPSTPSGGNGDTTSTDTPNGGEDNSTPPADSQTVLHLNEAVEFGNFELKIIDVRLKDDGFSIDYSTGARSYDGSNVVVIYSLKNIGKNACRPIQRLLQLNYADGYTFLCDEYINGRHPNIYANGGVNSAEELQVLSSEQYYLEAFTVPPEVLNNSDEPLFLTLAPDEFAPLLRFDIRPIDDTEKEALYQQAVDLMGEERYPFARENLTMIGEYKDANDLLLECYVKSYSGYEYLSEHKEDFRVLSGEEIQAMLIGTWEGSDGETWIFSEDGTLDPGRTKPIDGSKVIFKWAINGEGLFEIIRGSGSDTYEIREIYPGAIMLFTNEGKVYRQMWVANP